MSPNQHVYVHALDVCVFWIPEQGHYTNVCKTESLAKTKLKVLLKKKYRRVSISKHQRLKKKKKVVNRQTLEKVLVAADSESRSHDHVV